MPSHRLGNFVDIVVGAMEGRGTMSNNEIYRAVKMQAEKVSWGLAKEWEAQVRETLQAYCPGRPEHEKRGRPGDYFVFHADGYWSCKAKLPTIDDLLV
jgi:hypothetical protein